MNGRKKKNKNKTKQEDASTNHGGLLSVLLARPPYSPGPGTSLTNPLSYPISCDSPSTLIQPSSQPTAASDTSHLHQHRHPQFPPCQEASIFNTTGVYANLRHHRLPTMCCLLPGPTAPKSLLSVHKKKEKSLQTLLFLSLSLFMASPDCSTKTTSYTFGDTSEKY